MIITIDGPAGAGKSSTAKALARRLGFAFLDTGAMYRAIALAALRASLDLTQEDGLAALVENVHLNFQDDKILLDGADVSEAIRTQEVTVATGPVADSPAVRRRLVQLQRDNAKGRNIVSEGRDQGTIVFPEAQCKFFLVADSQERARRRQREMVARGERVELDAILLALETRDRRDAARDLAPMRPAADALVLDSTLLPLDQVVDRMEAEVRRRSHS
jgi:cytidylate kinase